ncbi:hypothetical protein SAMN05421881_10219 [Nitrosomonas halophila]|uniref:Uncharacterized protein n=1 Tax=Nitrosomonas halophila TaxID=44576 RepID=A0A1H3HNR0_9PROT|nr:hypothetical protein SAMN05421881_10219 [Nitrosomonas halophila]
MIEKSRSVSFALLRSLFSDSLLEADAIWQLAKSVQNTSNRESGGLRENILSRNLGSRHARQNDARFAE